MAGPVDMFQTASAGASKSLLTLTNFAGQPSFVSFK